MRAARIVLLRALPSAFPGYPARFFTNDHPQGRGLIEGGVMDRWAKAKRQERVRKAVNKGSEGVAR